jgi:hypothetical protein
VFFSVVSIILIKALLLETSLSNYLVKNCEIFKRAKIALTKREAISNDYYDQINFRFLLSEHERGKKNHEELMR